MFLPMTFPRARALGALVEVTVQCVPAGALGALGALDRLSH